MCIVDTFFRLFHLFGLYFDSLEYLSIILTICMKSKYTNEKKIEKKIRIDFIERTLKFLDLNSMIHSKYVAFIRWNSEYGIPDNKCWIMLFD